MLCKLTSKNQITLPKELLRQCGAESYFDARVEGNRIILEPVAVHPIESSRLAGVRDRIAELGLSEEEVDGIVAEARRAYGS